MIVWSTHDLVHDLLHVCRPGVLQLGDRLNNIELGFVNICENNAMRSCWTAGIQS